MKQLLTAVVILLSLNACVTSAPKGSNSCHSLAVLEDLATSTSYEIFHQKASRLGYTYQNEVNAEGTRTVIYERQVLSPRAGLYYNQSITYRLENVPRFTFYSPTPVSVGFWDKIIKEASKNYKVDYNTGTEMKFRKSDMYFTVRYRTVGASKPAVYSVAFFQ